MLKYVLIAVGGRAGPVLRYWLHDLIQRASGGRFPLGTLSIKLTGSLVLGALAAVFLTHTDIREEYRLGLTVGVLGGFTTFSTFSLETFKLIEAGSLGMALGYVLASCAGGVLASSAGYWLATRMC